MQVIKYPADILRQECEKVKNFDSELLSNVEKMKNIMNETDAVGLAANQVGLKSRLFLIREMSTDSIKVFVNPNILEKIGQTDIKEGCLSVPGFSAIVPGRASQVHVKARDELGVEFEIVAEGVEAVAIQHENDHLDGIMFLDKLPRKQRRLAEKFVRKNVDK